jgi:Tfp pilus assembly protein PilF
MAFLVFLAVPALAQSSFFDQGKAAMTRGDYEVAATLFEKAVAQSPKSSESHQWLGEAYGSLAQRANIFKQASLASKTRTELETAVQLDPNNIDARMGLVDYYMLAPAIMGGSESKAIEQATEIRKRDALAGHRAFARIYASQKKPELARKEYADMVKEQPASPKAHYQYGAYLMSAKDFAGAAAEFETSVKLDPSYMPGWFQIGHVSALAGNNFARGEEALKRYLAYKPAADEPPLARAHYWLGGVYEKQGRKAEAKAQYVAALKLTPASKEIAEALKRVS